MNALSVPVSSYPDQVLDSRVIANRYYTSAKHVVFLRRFVVDVYDVTPSSKTRILAHKYVVVRILWHDRETSEARCEHKLAECPPWSFSYVAPDLSDEEEEEYDALRNKAEAMKSCF